MKLKVSQGGVPAGSYMAEGRALEAVEADPVRGYGEGLRWVLEVTTGPHKGQKTGRITTAVPTARNACGRFLSGILGRPLRPDEEVDLAEVFIGQTFVIVVAATEGGGTRVESIAPPPK